MKQYLTLLLLFTVAINCYGQKIKFTDTGNVWLYNFSTKDLDVIKYECYYLDTLVKIDTLEYNFFASKEVIHNSRHYYIKKLVREDSLGRIYVRNLSGNDTAEQLLFDYNMQVGDTTTAIDVRDTFTHYLSKIDTVFIDNIPHRVFEMNTTSFSKGSAYKFIEGVGCTSGPFFPFSPQNPESSTILLCFSVNGGRPTFSKQIDWLNNTTSCYLSIENQKNDIKKVSIYPQPANSSFSVDLTEAINGTLRIYTTLGQIVTIQAIKHERTIHFENQLNLHGLYYYRITTDNGSTISGKIIFK